MNFYSVAYKLQFGGSGKAIVQAENQEQAELMFYDEEDEFGPKNEVKNVAKSRQIPKGWIIELKNYKYATIMEDEKIGDDRVVYAMALAPRGSRSKYEVQKYNFSDIRVATPPQKKHIM